MSNTIVPAAAGYYLLSVDEVDGGPPDYALRRLPIVAFRLREDREGNIDSLPVALGDSAPSSWKDFHDYAIQCPDAFCFNPFRGDEWRSADEYFSHRVAVEKEHEEILAELKAERAEREAAIKEIEEMERKDAAEREQTDAAST